MLSLWFSIHSKTKTDFYLQVRGQGPEGKIKQMEIQEAGLDQTIDPTEGYARKKAWQVGKSSPIFAILGEWSRSEKDPDEGNAR